MPPLLVGSIAVIAVVVTLIALFVGIALHKHRKATGLLLVGRITEAVSRAGESGVITQSPTIANAHLRQATLTSPDVTVECSWPADWPAPQDERALHLVRMFVGHLEPAPWMGYLELTFALTHGLGANAGRTPKHMIIYTISGENAHGKQISYAGTLTQEHVELPTYVQKLSDAITCIEQRLNAQNPT